MNLRRASVPKIVVEAEIRRRHTVNISQGLALERQCWFTCKLLSRCTHNPKAASYPYIRIIFSHLFTYSTGKFRWYSELIKQGQELNAAELCLQVMLVSLTLWKRTDYELGTAVAQWLRCCATIRNVAGSIPAGVSGFFIDLKSFWSRYFPGVDSASNRNEYQEYFLGVKTAGA